MSNEGLVVLHKKKLIYNIIQLFVNVRACVRVCTRFDYSKVVMIPVC